MNYPHILTIDNAGFDVDLIRYDEHIREIAIGTIAKVLEVDEGTIRYAFKSKAPELATLKQFKLRSAQIGRLRFTTMPLEAAGIILQYHASKGNARAIAWLNANWQQNLEREADAFEGIVKTREQYKVELKEKFEELLELFLTANASIALNRSDEALYQQSLKQKDEAVSAMTPLERDRAYQVQDKLNRQRQAIIESYYPYYDPVTGKLPPSKAKEKQQKIQQVYQKLT